MSRPKRPASAVGKAAGSAEPSQPEEPPAGHGTAAGGLLSMRGADDRENEMAVPSSPQSDAPRDRLASFRRRPQPVPGQGAHVVTRAAEDGLEMVRYDDGGRLLRGDGNGGGPPGKGVVGLLSLASSQLGGATGQRACDTYRRWSATADRTLILLVDTSGSIVADQRAPAALVCAAGAALSALHRGCAVSVINFSSESLRIPPTHDKDTIYSVLSRIQGASTVLPPLSSLSLPQGPVDVVLVTDAGIHNLEQVLPDYRRTLQARPEIRALLYVLGRPEPKSVGAFRNAGFEIAAVEYPGMVLDGFALQGQPRPPQ